MTFHQLSNSLQMDSYILILHVNNGESVVAQVVDGIII